MAPSRKIYRNNNSAATAILERLIPPSARRRVAEVFAASCRHAHMQSPSCWELTLEPTFIRLNVGQVALLDAKDDRLFLCAAPSLPPLGAPAAIDRSRGPVYAAVPIRSVSLSIPLRSVSLIDRKVVSAHHRYITEAASRKRVSPFRSAHSPAAVTVLAGWAGIETPQPAYLVAAPDEADLSQGEIESSLFDVVASKEIEESAIRTVWSWYESRGWKVVSVERDKIGYDLRCRKGREQRHVEVKGRARSGGVVLLTAREWRRAIEDQRFVLAIVSNIQRDPILNQLTGLEFQRAYDIKPIVFHASRRRTEDAG